MVRVERAVRGVGALIMDFFGVSVTLLLRLLVKLAVEDSNVLVLPGVGLVILCRRPAATKGWRRAA